jgi:L-ascorbate metabolism protein UlaG (beta-lactamase superfamily)
VPPESAHWLRAIGWLISRDVGAWDARSDARPGDAPSEHQSFGGLRVTFVNHATCLIQMDHLNVLTDPVWSDHVGPTSWLGLARRRVPGIRFEDLPPIDAVLISHDHYDHLDLPTLQRLSERFRPRVFAGIGSRELLARHGIARVHELDWWESAELAPGVRLSFVPARHRSGRGPFDRNRRLWGGYVIEGSSGPVVFAGDTGYGPQFEEIRKRFGPARLALLPIGAYEPRWFMQAVHMNPAEAVRAHRDLDAALSVGIHFGTFVAGDDGQRQPLEDLDRALHATTGVRPDVRVLVEGEAFDVPRVTR